MASADQQTTYTTGLSVTATILNNEFGEIYTELDAAISEWATFTPTITASSVNPTVGNGTYVGRYKRVGDIICFTLRYTKGSTGTDGTGNYSFALPATASSNVAGYCSVKGRIYIAAEATYVASGVIEASATTVQLYSHQESGGIQALTAGGAGFNFATGDYVELSGTYEAATV